MAKALQATIDIQQIVNQLNLQEQKLKHQIVSLPLYIASDYVKNFALQSTQAVAQVAGNLEDFAFAELYNDRGLTELEKNVKIMIESAERLNNKDLINTSKLFQSAIQNAKNKYTYSKLDLF